MRWRCHSVCDTPAEYLRKELGMKPPTPPDNSNTAIYYTVVYTMSVVCLTNVPLVRACTLHFDLDGFIRLSNCDAINRPNKRVIINS
jgi:hypothetical protein